MSLILRHGFYNGVEVYPKFKDVVDIHYTNLASMDHILLIKDDDECIHNEII